MAFFIENEIGADFGFDIQKVAADVMEETLTAENCPYEVQVNLLITDNEGIHEINRQSRGVDAPHRRAFISYDML